MNILLDPLPETVNIGGAEYPIETDFRTSILFELLIRDGEYEGSEMILKGLDLYFHNSIPADLVEAANQMIWFYLCGKAENTQTGSKGEPDGDPGAESDDISGADGSDYSFEHDADYIYAAFFSAYGIDLAEIPYMHWWKFRALMRSLPQDCEFSRILGYRGIKITSKMSESDREFYRRMKRIYALPLPEKEQERHNKLVEILKNGGDPSALLGLEGGDR